MKTAAGVTLLPSRNIGLAAVTMAMISQAMHRP